MSALRKLKAAFQAEALFTLSSERNMIFYHWEELLKRGFPFIKIQVARDEFAGVDRSEVRLFLERAGYSPDDLRAILGRAT